MNKKTISYSSFKKYINKICHDINQSGWKPDYVVGLTRGGLLPAVMISHYYNIPCETLKICLRDNSDTESNLWMPEDAIGYIQEENRKENGGWEHLNKYRKNILIVDDINDSGATLNWLMDDWAKSVAGCLPEEEWADIWNSNVRFAVVVDNLASKCNVKMDYCAFEINKAEENVWIDFPYEDWWTK